MLKTFTWRELSLRFLATLFSRFYKMKTRTVIKILRHGSLSHNRKNTYVKFHILGWFIKPDICVKKTPRKIQTFRFVQLLFFKYPFYSNFVSVIIFLDRLAFNQCLIFKDTIMYDRMN